MHFSSFDPKKFLRICAFGDICLQCSFQGIHKPSVGLLIGCADKANCLHVGPGPMGGGNALRESFSNGSNPYLREFRRKPRKTQTC